MVVFNSNVLGLFYLSDIWQFSSDCAHNAALHLYITHTADMLEELTAFQDSVVPHLRQIVEANGHYLNVINFPLTNELEVDSLYFLFLYLA